MPIYPSYKRPIEYINDRAYIIHAVFPIDRVKDSPGLKEWLGCETTFKSNQNGTYVFCSKIEEAQIVE
jgi:hypothetical protein